MKNIAKVFLGLCLALALGSVRVSAQSVSSAGGPINAQFSMPFPPSAPSCTIVTPSTHSPTAVVAAAATQRLALYIINSSTLTMSQASAAGNAATRPPDEYLLFANSLGNAGTVGIGPALANLPLVPGIRLRGMAGTVVTESATDSSNRLYFNASGIPQGALWAISESTGATINVQAKLTVCDIQAQ